MAIDDSRPVTNAIYRTYSPHRDERFWSVEVAPTGDRLIVRAWTDSLTKSTTMRLKRFGLEILVEHEPVDVDLGPRAAFLKRVVEYKQMLRSRGHHPMSFPPLLVHSEDANGFLSEAFQRPYSEPHGNANFFGVPCVWHRDLDGQALR